MCGPFSQNISIREQLGRCVREVSETTAHYQATQQRLSEQTKLVKSEYIHTSGATT